MRLILSGFLGALVLAGSVGSALALDCADDPARTGISRTIAISPTDGLRFGRLQYSQTAPLRDMEVILSFDDGPALETTQSILDTLDRHCVKATFFSVGTMAIAHPQMLKIIAQRGHTIGVHTWSHPRSLALMPVADAKMEIEKGFAAVSYAAGGQPIAPFFRFPGLNDSPELDAYLASRNISVWSVDVVSDDTAPGMTQDRLINNVFTRLRQMGRGIILFHDLKKVTAETLDEILARLKMEGYKIAHVVSNTAYIPDTELLAKMDFQKRQRTVAFTGQPIGGTTQNQAPLSWSVDYAHTEQVYINSEGEAADLMKRSSAVGKTTPAQQPENNAALGEKVLGEDVLLSTELKKRNPAPTPQR